MNITSAKRFKQVRQCRLKHAPWCLVPLRDAEMIQYERVLYGKARKQN